MDVGSLTALIGGTLALLSPCGALSLLSLFAVTAGSGARLWAHGAWFSVGLLVVLVPLGLRAGVLGPLFASLRDDIIIGASILMVALGIIQLLGFGFDPSRFDPGAQQLQKQANQRTGWLKTDRKSTRLNSSHVAISYAVFCLKKKKTKYTIHKS